MSVVSPRSRDIRRAGRACDNHVFVSSGGWKDAQICQLDSRLDSTYQEMARELAFKAPLIASERLFGPRVSP
jgi:hypothetical protein